MKLKIALWSNRPDSRKNLGVFCHGWAVALVLALSACSSAPKDITLVSPKGSAAKGEPLSALQRFQMEFNYLLSPSESLAEAWYRERATMDSTHPYRPIPPEDYPNLGTVPPRPAGTTNLQRQRFLDSLESDYQQLWQNSGNLAEQQSNRPWRSFRLTPDLPPAVEKPAAAEAPSTPMVVQVAPAIDSKDAEIQRLVSNSNFNKIAVVYFMPNQDSLTAESKTVLLQIILYHKTNPYRLRLVGLGKMTEARVKSISTFLIEGGVPARLIDSKNTPKATDEEGIEIYTY
ncbi:MAG: hypothetical protein QM523_04725 [Candidatus Pacebacteria bacterium]|nr:hypothetical protein [Candidatus Paceibacterota bacterium]